MSASSETAPTDDRGRALRAWWAGDLATLRQSNSEMVLGELSTRLVETHSLNRRTRRSRRGGSRSAFYERWGPKSPEPGMSCSSTHCCDSGGASTSVLLTDRAILVLEFKIGATAFEMRDRRQVEDYALDLFDFHAGSRSHPIVPILIASDAPSSRSPLPLIWHGVTPVLDANAQGLRSLLHVIADRIPFPSSALSPAIWQAAPYRPVPTIVQAAQMLYGRHGVREIAESRTDVGNLTRTTRAITAALESALADKRHHVMFVTGIPGAGKTLCGLNAVFVSTFGAAFLTGNLPLVHVLREALARDSAGQERSLRQARQQAESAIQPLIGFLRDNSTATDPPHERVIVFDEAQRAWDAAFGKRQVRSCPE